MAEVFGVVASAIALIDVLLKLPKNAGLSLLFFTLQYKSAGIILWFFGSREVWQMQMQVLGSPHDTDAMNFKKSVQEDSSIVAVAGTILAQIAITALSLEYLSQTHWIARAFFIFSLVSSIIAVYYATRQYRILGRCLRAEQVKAWIKNKDLSTGMDIEVPSVASVVTVSAPNMLLSSSLNSFLVGLGVYLGFIWTQNLDETAGVNGSRAVFITYIVALCVCYGVYALSSAVVADQAYVSEEDLLRIAGVLPLYASGSPGRKETGRGNNGVPTQTSANASRGSSLDPSTRQVSPGRQLHRNSISNDDSTRRELLEVFQEASKLREASAKVDERLARLLEKFGEETMG